MEDNHKQAIVIPNALPVLTAEKVLIHQLQHSVMLQIMHAQRVASDSLALQALTPSLD